MDTRHAVVNTLLGKITLVASGESVVGLYFPQHWHRPARDTLGAEVAVADDALLSQAAAQFGEYLAGERMSFDLPTVAIGDPLKQRVWRLLPDIPRGETVTYGELAKRAG